MTLNLILRPVRRSWWSDKNAMLKMTPSYTICLLPGIGPYETKDKLNGENAAAIILTSLSRIIPMVTQYKLSRI